MTQYNPGKFLWEWFPNQFKNIPSILAWTLVLIADIALVIWLSYLWGIGVFADEIPYGLGKLVVMLYIGAVFGLFALETVVFNWFCKLFR